MAAEHDYYDILGVPRDADAKTIRDAYRKLALRWHPDRCKEPEAEERFKEIAEAYAVLRDPQRRAAYDTGGSAAFSGLSAEDLFRDADLDDIFGGFGLGLGGGLFDRLFGGAPWARRGADVRIALAVPLERIAAGGEETVRFPRRAPCAACGGSGAEPGTRPRPCETCGGSGRQVRARRGKGVSVQQVAPCPACGGRGRTIEQPCKACGGGGETEREEALALTIPPGIEDGTALRVPGHGLPAEGEAGAPPGDLLVVVRAAPDRRFTREGADLWHAEPLALVDAVLGTELTVPTLDGALSIKVPAGTQPGAVLRLRGHGLPRFGGGGRGDLLLRLDVQVPERLTRRERALYESLRKLARRVKRASVSARSAARS